MKHDMKFAEATISAFMASAIDSLNRAVEVADTVGDQGLSFDLMNIRARISQTLPAVEKLGQR